MIYPPTPLHRPDQLQLLMGSLWDGIYGSSDQVTALASVIGEAYLQTLQNLAEYTETISRHSCPLLHRVNWKLLSLKRSEALPEYRYHVGDPDLVGAAGSVGDLTGPSRTYRLSGLDDCPAVFNRVNAPTVSMLKGLDYEILQQDGEVLIRFREDPFENSRIVQIPVFNSIGEATDQQLLLWAYAGDQDWQYVYEHFGYVLGMESRSTEGYKQLVNAVFDAVVGGSSEMCLRLAVAAMTGAPLVREPVETVELVGIDDHGPIVVTDLSVHRGVSGSNPVVDVGDVVRAGDPLYDSFQLYALNRGEVPPLSGLCLLPRHQALRGGGLVFVNREVPLEISSEGGRTRVEFYLAGKPADIEAFWAEVRRREAVKEYTLAERLDTRTVVNSEPTPLTLPATINPMKFLIQENYRPNAMLLRVRQAGVDATAQGLFGYSVLRKIIPPHNSLLVSIEMPEIVDPATMLPSDDEIDLQPAMEPAADETEADPVTETITIRRVQTC